MTRREEEKTLLKRSRDFLETAEYQTSKGFYDIAVFSLEQAMQLFLKAKCWRKVLSIQGHTALELFWRYWQSWSQKAKNLS